MGKIGIIIQREYNERVRKRTFIITTLLTPLLLVAVMFVPILLQVARTAGTRDIIVADGSGVIAGRLVSDRMVDYEISALPAEELRVRMQEDRIGDAFGILAIGADIFENPRNVQLYSREASTMELESAIAGQIQEIIENEKLKEYDIENLSQILTDVNTPVSMQAYRVDASGIMENSSATSMILSLVFGLLIYMFVFMYSAMVMSGVIEEKNSKVLEVMVSSVKPFQLMMGKIVGIAAVALTQLLIWIILILILASAGMYFLSGEMMAQAGEMMSGAGGVNMPSGIDAEMLNSVKGLTNPLFLLKMFGGFLVFFIGGYLLYSAMFAAIGSAVDNAADTQQLQLPVTIPMVLAIFVMMNVINDPNSSLAVWFSMIPFTSPIIMMARIPYGVPAWEILLSAAILYGTFMLFVWLAGKIYRVGIFMYGKKPTFREIMKWARYKY